MAEGSEPSYFMNTCHIFFTPPPSPPLPFQILSTSLHLPCCLQSPSPLLIVLPCFFDWIGDHATFDVPFSLTISWMYTCQVLRPWCMFYAARRQVYWGLTCGFLQVHWFDITHSQTHMQRHTAHSGASILTHPYKCYLHQFSCAHSSYLYCTEWRIYICQTFTFYIVFFSKIILLQK